MGVSLDSRSKGRGVVPHLQLEREVGYPRLRVAGVDEVGRGCLAGPVVAGAVIVPADLREQENPWLVEIRDSKLLTPAKRESLAPLIQKWAMASALGVASVLEIDQLNIHHAAQLAMRRAIEALSVLPAHVLVDGKFPLKSLFCPTTAIVKGDQKSLSIACASILAKVWRDQHMDELDQTYPGYGLSIHKGYPTPAHKQFLKNQGVSEVHRRTFGPVAELLR